MPLQHPKIRADLIIQPDAAEEGYFFVKDPVRREFFRFNELQVEMMQRLDGRSDRDSVNQYLDEEFGITITEEQYVRFIDRLERDLLLDVTSYTVDDARARKAIQRRLTRRGLIFRATLRDSTSSEALMFTRGMEQILDGDPCQAASYFQAVLEINPNNERARAVLVSIHEAFFRSRIKAPSYLVMLPLLNPNRLLGMIDRRIGRLVFHPIGVLLLSLFILSAIPPLVDIMQQPGMLSGFSVADFAVFLAVTLISLGWHELIGHGLACKHYGGQVHEVGLLLMYGVIPGAYCDTSDTYFFTGRRPKILVSLAGPFAHLVIQAACWHLLAVLDSSVWLWKGMLLAQLVMFLPNFTNFVPLDPADGYHALREYLNVVSLRERSFQFVKGKMQRWIFGVHSNDPEPNQRERKIFLVFGIALCVYTVFLVYGLWISFLLPLAVEYLGNLGIVLTILYFANLLGRVMLVKFVRFVWFLVRERRTIFTWRRTTAFSIVIAATTAALAQPWPLYIDGEMVLEPNHRAHARALEAGLLEDVRVREGEQVEAGQVIATMSSDGLARELKFARQDLIMARARLAMIELGARPEEVALAGARERASRVTSNVYLSRLRHARTLQNAGIWSSAAVQPARAEAALALSNQRLAGLDTDLLAAGSRKEEILAARADLQRLEARLAELESRLDNLTIRSPANGIVVGYHLEDFVGRWLERGTTLAEIHDVSQFQVRITPDPGEPVDGLEVGQRVALRPLGFPHELVSGKIGQILPSATGDESTVVYTELRAPQWRTGMTGHARVYRRERSVAYRLIAIPIIQIVDYDLWRRL